MCSTCGCSQPSDAVTIVKIGEDMHDPHHHHHHDHDHEHYHDHDHHHHGHSHTVTLEQDILQKNNLLAQRVRGYLEAKGVLALNLVSSPGSGKTSLLERTLQDLKGKRAFFVIEGDQQTTRDAERIAAAGAPVVQVNTGQGCHLDSEMVHQAVKKLDPSQNSVLFIENVGNLVCPALFDLGETKRVVVMSVTEGDDKPLKYPDMFHTSNLCVINKTDLLPYVPFDVEQFKQNALRINHHLEFVELSAYTGAGMDQWYNWLEKQV